MGAASDRIANFFHALSSEIQILARACGKSDVHHLEPEGMAERANVPEVVDQLRATVSQLNKMLATERPEIQTILAELRETMDSLNDLVSNLRERPSELLFGNPPRKSEMLK